MRFGRPTVSPLMWATQSAISIRPARQSPRRLHVSWLWALQLTSTHLLNSTASFELLGALMAVTTRRQTSVALSLYLLGTTREPFRARNGQQSVNRLVKRPSAEQTWKQLVQIVCVCVCVWGEGRPEFLCQYFKINLWLCTTTWRMSFSLKVAGPKFHHQAHSN